MKKSYLPLWSLVILALSLAPLRAETAPAYPVLGPGVEYSEQRIGEVPWAIYVVKIDRSRSDLHLLTMLSQEQIYALSPVSAQIQALPAEVGTPVAAVNGDFFDMEGPYQGTLCGIQIRRGELVSLPDTASFWLDSKGRPQIGKITIEARVQWPDGAQTPFLLNRERYANSAVVYSSAFGPSTHTKGGKELVLERDGDSPWLPLRAGQTYSARVRAVREDGDTPLAAGTLVLSLDPKLAERLPAMAPGMTLRLSFAAKPNLDGVTEAIGGMPVLLNHKKKPTWGKGSEERHPRTVIGWNKTHLFLIVVDGRQKNLSAGMSIPELADLARRLGCTDAMNLDGGGSSTLWLGGKIMNVPSDGHERPVSNALLIIRK